MKSFSKVQKNAQDTMTTFVEIVFAIILLPVLNLVIADANLSGTQLIVANVIGIFFVIGILYMAVKGIKK